MIRLVEPPDFGDVPLPDGPPEWLIEEWDRIPHHLPEGEGLLLSEGEDGQWEPARDPDAEVVQAAIKRPDFGEVADKATLDSGLEFYGRADALSHRAQVILDGSAPLEVGLRAILDLHQGSSVPMDHGGWYHVEKATLAAHMLYSDGLVYFYGQQRGYWRSVGFERILSQIQLYNYARWGKEDKNGNHKVVTVGEPFVQAALRPALRHIARHGDAAEGGSVRGFFDQDHVVPGLCMKDGFWTVRGKQIVRLPHSPWHRARSGYDFVIPMLFDLQAEGAWEKFKAVGAIDGAWSEICPTWHWLLQSSMPGQDDDAAFLQEFIAASLTGQATQYQRGVILVGRPGSGKSTIVKAIEQLFPRGSVAHTDPSGWQQDYQRTGLVGRLLNTVDEALGRSVAAVLQPLKRCVTGDTIEARFLQKDPFEYRPIAGQLYSCNDLPAGADSATIDRFELIRFRQRFRGSDQQVAEDRILARVRQELPGFILWVFHGWLRLVEQGRYTKPAGSVELKKGWAEDSDLVQAWLARQCEVAEGVAVQRSIAFASFLRWCEQMAIPDRKRVDGLEFKRRLNALGYEDCKTGKARDRAYKGFKLASGGGK